MALSLITEFTSAHYAPQFTYNDVIATNTQSVTLQIPDSSTLSALEGKRAQRRNNAPSKIPHPTLGTIEVMPRADKTLAHAERIRNLETIAQIYQFNSVGDSTKHAYMIGWRHWTVDFCQNEMNCCPLLKTRYADFEFGDNMEYGSYLLLIFFCWLTTTIGVIPATASSYMSAVRFMLRNSGVDDNIFDHPRLTRTKTGAELLYRIDNPAREDTHKLPFTCDMIVRSTNLLGTSPEDQMEALAIKLALVGLLRFSEYADTGNSTAKHHFIRGDDVCFTLTSATTGSKLRVPGSEAYKANSDHKLQGVTFTIPSSKKDTFGTGFRLSYNILDDEDKTSAFDIAKEMYNFARLAKPRPNDPFLSIGGTKQIKRDHFTKTIKRIASFLGFDPSRFSTHSLRIGGATALASDPTIRDSTIQTMGRWKSLAFLDYIRKSAKMMQAALLRMVDPTAITTADLENLDTRITLRIPPMAT
jgi:hypothetical protein